jgi:hypothetical protein
MMSVRWPWRLRAAIALALATAALALLTAAPAAAEAMRNWRLAFEVLSPLHAQPAGRKATYHDKERLTRAALAEIVPNVWTTLDIEATRARSRVRLGGYGTEINPAIHSHLLITETKARRLAAALGYVFRQSAVLLYDLTVAEGEQHYVTVRFARRTLTLARVAAYFARARTDLGSDKLGFSELGPRLIFINIDTGIADAAFAAGLRRAALRHPEIKVEPPRPVRAIFIGNDWSKSPGGEDYVKLLGPASGQIMPELTKLQRRFDGRVRRWAHFLH